jgi:hypothetical protein
MRTKKFFSYCKKSKRKVIFFNRDVKLFVRDKNYSIKLAKKLIKKGLLIEKFLFFMKLYQLANILIVKQQKFRIWPLFKQLFDIFRFDKFYSNKKFNIFSTLDNKI